MTTTLHFIDPWRNRSNHIACPNTLTIRIESARIHITLLILYLGHGQFLIYGWQSSPWLCFELLTTQIVQAYHYSRQKLTKLAKSVLTPFKLVCFQESCHTLNFWSFIDTELVGIFQIFAITQYHSLMLHRHYHGCRWPGSQSINNNNCSDPRLPEYHSFSTNKTMYILQIIGTLYHVTKHLL